MIIAIVVTVVRVHVGVFLPTVRKQAVDSVSAGVSVGVHARLSLCWLFIHLFIQPHHIASP